MSEDVWNLISVDPLFRSYAKIAQDKNLREPSSKAHTGKVLVHIGRYSMNSHVFSDCVLVALSDSQKTCWQFIWYALRNIHGIGRNLNGDPKLYMKWKPTEIIEKARIKGRQSFYNSIKILRDRRIIFFKGENLYLNIFPLTWNLEAERMDLVRDIVQKELNKIENRES